VSGSTGWVSGAGGTILRTLDGGSTWTPQSSGTPEDLNAVFFLTPSRGWAVGTNGTILSTSNGGAAWTLRHFEYLSPSNLPITPSFTDVRFLSDARGTLVGNTKEGGVILTTADGGSTWTRQPRVLFNGGPAGLNALSFGDALHGWAVGQFGVIMATSDGGSSWTEDTSGSVETLNGVSFINATTGWAAGTHGVVLKTTTGGR
jgi:photosystem II stability/assembly factor-like uncharacterized protein